MTEWDNRVLVVVSLTRDVYGPFQNWAAAVGRARVPWSTFDYTLEEEGEDKDE